MLCETGSLLPLSRVQLRRLGISHGFSSLVLGLMSGIHVMFISLMSYFIKFIYFSSLILSMLSFSLLYLKALDVCLFCCLWFLIGLGFGGLWSSARFGSGAYPSVGFSMGELFYSCSLWLRSSFGIVI